VAKIIAQTKLQSLRLNRNPLGDAGLGPDPMDRGVMGKKKSNGPMEE